ncbi:hypothetical protein FSP39_000506 [Pinctada imbricata]|uniref:Uncharacterized protein n=1 Tax=Pinctada imbricata TaxID=66713 RepID=A0AA89C9H8_PINIB|nr:hypothetical protein FSP39_000506 [Pinctada imbricata]
MADTEHRNRIVFLGSGGVGKSSILGKFLTGKFSSEYKETVEDLYSREYDIKDSHLLVDFLDTAGNIAFPAMRRLSISSAHAFVLVYSITEPNTFEEAKQLWEQIKEVRENYDVIPCVLVGNKLDLENKRLVEKFDALNWADNENLGGAFLEASAKTNEGVTEIFKNLLEQVKTPRHAYDMFQTRRSSIHALEQTDDSQTGNGGEEHVETPEQRMRRSRSLIRRGSKPKLKKCSRDRKNDCCIS